MKEAVSLNRKWFALIGEMKKERSIPIDEASNIKYKEMIGSEFSDFTSTLGSLEAKEISSNPEFAALIVLMLSEANLDSGSTAGVMLSGSFPALSISVLAALQTMSIKPVIVSSLGASMYGANQPGASWLDMEQYLRKKGNLLFSSTIVTLGAEGDTGGGLREEGIQTLMKTAERHSVRITLPSSFENAVKLRTDLFIKEKIDILINIGGSQTAMGSCIHSIKIPNGLNLEYQSCTDNKRGVIARISEENIPFIHLLNIKDLASENGIVLQPGKYTPASYYLYSSRKINTVYVIFMVAILYLFTFFLFKKDFAAKRNF